MPTTLMLLNLAAMVSIGMTWGFSRGARPIRPDELANRLVAAQDNERQRLSRDLHDQLGQLLTAATLQLQWLLGRLPADLQAKGDALQATLTESLGNVRDLSGLLNPRQLASLGLETSLRQHLVRTLENLPLHWSLECQSRMEGLPQAMSMAAFRIAQEAVTNVLRHAQAQNLSLRLRRAPEGLLLTILDDGQGFDPARDPAAAGQRGMAGMHERAQGLGGQLTVQSRPGGGTRIDVVLPWPDGRRTRAQQDIPT